MIRNKMIPVAMVAALSVQGCSEDAGQSAMQEPVVSQAHTLQLQATELVSRYVTSGTVASDHRVSISSRISGYIRKLSVDEGDRVKRGQVLLRVDPVNVRQSLVQAEADLADAKADLDRYEELFRQRAASQQQLDRVRLRYKVARSQVEQAKNQLSYAEVRSPVNGVVVVKHKSKGDLASPGAPILGIEDPASLLVETYVSEQFVGGIRVGDPVEIAVASTDKKLAGVVRQVVQAAAAMSHQFLIKVSLKSYNGVKPGMYAQVGFATGSRKALMVPQAAVIERAGLNGIYLVDADGIARYRQIRLGQQQGKQVEVLAGLKDGDVIAWNGNPALKTGMKVQDH